MIFRKFYYTVIALACAALVYTVQAQSYTLVHASSSEITCSFTQEPTMGSTGNILLLGIACPQSTSVSAHALLQTGLVLSTHITTGGFKGSYFIRWVKVTLPSGNNRQSGTITLRGVPSFGTRAASATLKQGIIWIESDKPLNKTSDLSEIPTFPYTEGLRIEVSQDGIYRISGSHLENSGISLRSIPAKDYRLFCQGREIPLHLTNGAAAMLSRSDFIYFYGTQLRGDSSYLSQFSTTNVYWLTWKTGTPGARMAQGLVGLKIDALSWHPGDSTTFVAHDRRDTLHLEEDNDIRWLGTIGDPQEMSQSPSTNQFVDNWYWETIGANQNNVTTVNINIPAPAQRGTARITIALTGQTYSDQVSPDHQVTILINNKTPGSSQQIAKWDGQNTIVFTTDEFPVSLLHKGSNTISFITQSAQAPAPTDISELNWIRLEYDRGFEASENELQFTASTRDIGSIREFKITGFSSPLIDLWDITTGRFCSGYSIRSESDSSGKSSFALSFQDSLETPCTYIALAPSNYRTPYDMRLDSLPALTDRIPGTLDYLMIAARSCVSALKPLADWHTAHGLSVLLVSYEDIANRFAGGIRDPEAIRTFVRYVMEHTPGRSPTYLLLGGDSSHDLDKNRDRSNLNLVPIHLARIPGWGPAADDGYFASVIGNDNVPDLYVGRFPARDSIDMRIMVNKTIGFMQSKNGPWKDNMLFAGGIEPEFTTLNDDAQQIVGSRMNQFRMDAYHGSPFWVVNQQASGMMKGFLNAGVYCVNFNGHGGGNVWSDANFFGLQDVKLLHNNEWSGGGRLPMILSFTCLTGFFESVFYQSLGEEMLRLPSGGSAGFYGASAYTSKEGNLQMNRLFLDAACQDTSSTIGELIWAAETRISVINDVKYLPLVRQYNLLGDPAVPFSLRRPHAELKLDKPVIAPGSTINATVSTPNITRGAARFQLITGSRKIVEQLIPVENSMAVVTSATKADQQGQSGYARVFAYNDTTCAVGWQTFSLAQFIADSITTNPEYPAAGDSVHISCRLSRLDSTPITTVRCLYTVDVPWSTAPVFAPSADVGMQALGLNRFTMNNPLTIPSIDKPETALFIKFRSLEEAAETPVFRIMLAPRADLAISLGPTVVWHNDTLKARITCVNTGGAPADPFYCQFLLSAPGFNDSLITISAGSLGAGAAQIIECPLPDTSGMFTISATVNSTQAVLEANYLNNTAILDSQRIISGLCSSIHDSITSAGGGVTITRAATAVLPYKIFLFGETTTAIPVGGSQPIPLGTDGNMQWRVHTRPALAAGDSLTWIFKPATSLALGKATVVGNPAVFYFDSLMHHWKIALPVQHTDSTLYGTFAATGPFLVATNPDNIPPRIILSVGNRTMRFLDYAAKEKPFNLEISDINGVDPGSIEISINGRALPKESYTTLAVDTGFYHLRTTVYPLKQNAIDSLFVRAKDFLNNDTTVVFAYLPGEKLSLKFFSCHPNPFSAAKIGVHPVRLAYLVTDEAQSVAITLYTMSGHIVKKWNFSNILGYQEVEWDGRSQNGYRLANGTYYCKIIAKNRETTVSRIIKIAKLEGF